MRKVIVHSPGGPEALVLEEFDLPKLAAGWVQVRTVAIPVNRADLAQRAGLFEKQKYPCTPGFEFCGEIIEVAEDVSTRFLNQKVYYWGDHRNSNLQQGAYASNLQLPLEELIMLPFEVDLLNFAASSSAGILALESLKNFRKAEQKILVTGASGGLGSNLLTIGTDMGHSMYAATTSEDKIDYCKSIGAKDAINIRLGSINDQSDGIEFDGVIDLLGYRTFEEGLKLVRPGGLLISVGTVTGAETQINLHDLQRGIRMRGLSRPVKQRIEESVAKLIRIQSKREFSTLISANYAIEDAPLVHEIIEKRQNKGRSVLLP